MTRYAWGLAVAISLTGCVVDETSSDDGDERMDAATADALVGDASTSDASSDRDAFTEDAFTGDAFIADAAMPGRDAGEPEPEDLCDATCTQLYSCFESDCEALASAQFLDDLCVNLCESPERLQRRLNGLQCGAYLDELTGFIPELDELCSDEPPPDECAPVCDFLVDCGADVDRDSCAVFCRGFEPDQLACLADASDEQACAAAFACFEEEEPPPPPVDPQDLCVEVCQRRNLCVSQDCAPGTLQPGDGQACVQDCLRDPPSEDEAAALSRRRCADIVDELSADPVFAGRCAADDMQACAQLCDDVVGDCVERDACLAACPGWNDTNLTCLRFTGGQCPAVDVCINSPDAQDRCETSCARWSECLGEACPPRILPPTLGVNCAAGCLFDPPEPEAVEAYVNLECAEVRALIYENNRELAPICEGDPEFNPGPDECVAFCERGLEACIGIGGRNFCLGACASLTREEYECALAAGEDCEAINACLPE